MSVILAIKKNDRIYMATDSQISCGEKMMKTTNIFDRKIRRLDNGILLGITGMVLGAQLVSAHPEIFTVPENGILTKKHIVQNIIPKLRKLYRENDMLEKEEDAPDSLTNSFLLAYKDKLFVIENIFSTFTVEHWAGIGNGTDLAAAGMFALDAEDVTDEQIIKERLIELLRITESRIRSVSAPFYLIDTVMQEYETVNY